MCKRKGFSDKEIKKLLCLAGRAKRENKSLITAFKEFSDESGRSFGAVRNFYYDFLAKAEKSGGDYLKYVNGLNLSVGKSERFTAEETDKLLFKVIQGKKENKSLRRIMYDLGDGDEKLTLRYQNKYRNLISKEPNILIETEKRAENRRNFKSTRSRAVREDLQSMVETASGRLKAENAVLVKRVAELQKENASLKGGA